MTPEAAAVTSFQRLAGKGLLVAGPTSGGQGGGPDLLFQAALRHADYTIEDFKLCPRVLP